MKYKVSVEVEAENEHDALAIGFTKMREIKFLEDIADVEQIASYPDDVSSRTIAGITFPAMPDLLKSLHGGAAK